MRVLSWPRAAELDVARICSVRDCGRIAKWGGEMCEDCADMDRELEAYWAERLSEKSRKAASRLADTALVGLFVVAMSALGYYIWPYVWLTFELWFGGN